MINMTKKRKIVLAVSIIAVSLAIIGIIAVGTFFGLVYGGGGVAYKGTVTDMDGNPIAGVSVTDGRHVVQTETDGSYKLKGWIKSKFVTVTIPTGYWTEDYYIPSGSVKNGEYDFKLEKQEEDYTDHNFIQVTDVEVGENGLTDELTTDLKEVTAETDPAFIIHTGDICYEGGLKSSINKLNTENMGVPVRYVIGNHDYVDGLYGEKLFESIYGPVMYSFEVGNVHYAVMPFGRGADRIQRYSRADANKWLMNDLAKVAPGKKVVVFCHEKAPDEENFELSEGLSEPKSMTEAGIIGWVFGHWHYNMLNEFTDQNGSLLHIGTSSPFGGIDSSVGSVRQINIKNAEIDSTKMHYTYYDGAEASESGYNWQIDIDSNVLYSEPLYVDGKIYVGTVDEDYHKGSPRKSGVYCIDETTHDILWSSSTENSIKNVLGYENGTLVAQDATGKVYAYDTTTATGTNVEPKWTYKINFSNINYTSQGLAVQGGVVYAGSSRETVALNLSDGKLKWKASANGESSPNKFTVAGDLLLVGANWSEYIAYNKTTGEKVWSTGGGYNTTTTALSVGDYLYLVNNDKLTKLKLSTGKELLTKSFNANGDWVNDPDEEGIGFNSAGTLTHMDGVLYIPTAQNSVIAVKADTFEKVWVSEDVKGGLIGTVPYSSAGAKSVVSTIVADEKYLVFGANDGNLYTLDRATGKHVDVYRCGSPILTKVIVSGGNIIFVDFDGRMTSIKYDSNSGLLNGHTTSQMPALNAIK